MKNINKITACAVLFFVCSLCATSPGFAGFIYQDFEPDNGSVSYGVPGGQSVVGFSLPGEPVHSGARSWKVVAQSSWGGTIIQAQVQPTQTPGFSARCL